MRNHSLLNKKFYILLKLVIFNTFFVGFVLNLITFFSTNWIKNESYAYGLFQYCNLVLSEQEQGQPSDDRETEQLNEYSFFYAAASKIIFNSNSPLLDYRCLDWTNKYAPSNDHLFHISFDIEKWKLSSNPCWTK